ncbi:MAG: IS1634 family transposase [Opitutales bacterium]|nr:IS1634 family transposase [Opitutales bacterium]
MYIRPCYREHEGKRYAYWALVESYRTERGPRQRIVAYLGQLDERGRLGVQQAAGDDLELDQGRLFDPPKPEWVEVDASRVRVERCRNFGGSWLGLRLLHQLGLVNFLQEGIPKGKEEIPWPMMGLVLVLSRFCHPSSELAIAEHHYRQSALTDLLGIPEEKVNEDRLYRTLDALLPHKADLEKHLKERLGELFALDYDLLLYDVTSTYFEGEANGNSLAARGYSRDRRGDCKQVCIALIVSRCGMPLGYEVFAGNRSDVTTVEAIVEKIEGAYGKANRIWAMDRGMVSEENVEFLKEGERRYILGTPKGMLKQFERELLAEDWDRIREGLEVKLCASPKGEETFILCRSAQRREKEKAIHERFEKRIESGLRQIEESCRKRSYQIGVIERRVGRLLGRNSRAAGLFEVEVKAGSRRRTQLKWRKVEAWRRWAELSEGCYLLRTNVKDWTAEELWKAYIQLTEAEAAFRIQKSDLRIRPIWHQRKERVEAHILVCFLAYVLWKTLAQRCQRAGLGDDPRKVLEELQQIRLVDVVLPTKKGIEIRKRCISRPSDHQAILLERLGLRLPAQLKIEEM